MTENPQVVTPGLPTTPVAPEQNFTQEAVTTEIEPTQQKPANNTFFILLIAAFLVLVVGGFLMMNREFSTVENITPDNSDQTQTDASTSQDVQAPTSAATLDMNPVNVTEMVAFTKEDSYQIWLNQTGSETKISGENEAVEHFVVSPNNDVIAYTFGKLTTNQNGAKYTYPDTVSLYDVKTKKSKTIYNLEPVVYEDKDNYTTQVTGIVFSADTKYLAISTSQEMHVYMLATGELKKVASTQPDPNERWFSIYHAEEFSPDNSKLLFRWGYYEGSSWAILDLATGKETAFSKDYTGYTGVVEGWLNNQEVFGTRVSNIDTQTDDSLVSIAIATGQEKVLQEFDGRARTSYKDGSVVYFLVSNSAELVDDRSQIFQRLIVLNLLDNTTQSIELPTTAPSGDDLSLYGVIKSLNKDQLLIEGTHVMNRHDMFVYNLETNTLNPFKESAHITPGL